MREVFEEFKRKNKLEFFDAWDIKNAIEIEIGKGNIKKEDVTLELLEQMLEKRNKESEQRKKESDAEASPFIKDIRKKFEEIENKEKEVNIERNALLREDILSIYSWLLEGEYEMAQDLFNEVCQRIETTKTLKLDEDVERKIEELKERLGSEKDLFEEKTSDKSR